MNKLIKPTTIYTAVIRKKSKIAAHSIHLQIQSADLDNLSDAAEPTLLIYLADPYQQIDTAYRQYSIWNYNAILQQADLVINTFSKGAGSQWAEQAQVGDTLYFRIGDSESAWNDQAEHYFLIGDITALAHLYEINRALPVSKTVHSIIYGKQLEDFFPDLDQSYPLERYMLNEHPLRYIQTIVDRNLPALEQDSMALVYGESHFTSLIAAYLKEHSKIPLITTKNFWTNT